MPWDVMTFIGRLVALLHLDVAQFRVLELCEALPEQGLGPLRVQRVGIVLKRAALWLVVEDETDEVMRFLEHERGSVTVNKAYPSRACSFDE